MYETCKNGRYETGIEEITEEEYQKLLNNDSFNEKTNQKGEINKMSVPAYQRELSSMEFISKAQELLNFSVKMCLKMSKKYTYFGRAYTYEIAHRIVDNLLKANSLNLKENYNKRTELLNNALGDLACLSNHLKMIMPYIKFEKRFINQDTGKEEIIENVKKKDKLFAKWGILIGVCEKLIKGVKAKDKARLGV